MAWRLRIESSARKWRMRLRACCARTLGGGATASAGRHWQPDCFNLKAMTRAAPARSRCKPSLGCEIAQLPAAATAPDPVRSDSRTLAHQALHQLQHLAVFYENRHQLFDAAKQYNLVGLTLYNTGEYTLAVDSYRRAQTLYEGLGERYHLALVLQNIALVDWDLGRSSAALNTFRHALGLVNIAESPDLYALILDNEGLANRTAGRLDTALALHAQALELTSQTQYNSERSNT